MLLVSQLCCQTGSLRPSTGKHKSGSSSSSSIASSCLSTSARTLPNIMPSLLATLHVTCLLWLATDSDVTPCLKIQILLSSHLLSSSNTLLLMPMLQALQLSANTIHPLVFSISRQSCSYSTKHNITAQLQLHQVVYCAQSHCPLQHMHTVPHLRCLKASDCQALSLKSVSQ